MNIVAVCILQVLNCAYLLIVDVIALLRNKPYIIETLDPNFFTISISWSWSLRTWHSLSLFDSLIAFSDNEVMKASSAMTWPTQSAPDLIKFWTALSDQKPGKTILMPADLKQSVFFLQCVVSPIDKQWKASKTFLQYSESWKCLVARGRSFLRFIFSLHFSLTAVSNPILPL